MHRLYLKRTITETPWFSLYCLSPDKELSQLQGARIATLEDQGRIWVREDVVIFVPVRRTLPVGRTQRSVGGKTEPIRRRQLVRRTLFRNLRRTVRRTLRV